MTRHKTVPAILSLAVPGLGQLYNGQLWKACLFAAICLCFQYAVIQFQLFSTFSAMGLTLTAGLLFLIYQVRDAYCEAKLLVNESWGALRKVSSSVVFIVIIAVLIPDLRSYYASFSVPSQSHVPTLQPGDHFMVDKKYFAKHPLRRGDTIVFFDGTYQVVKRVIAIGGDRIEVNGTQVLLNDSPLEEPYANWKDSEFRIDFPLATVPDGHIFVMGDNRDQSKDSRHYSEPFIAVTQVTGKASYIYWSWADVTRIGRSL